VVGWNEIVKDKHQVARAAFLDWVFVGKPKQGPLFLQMKKTRAAFMLAVRFCKQHEDIMHADAYGNDLQNINCKRKYRVIKKSAKYINTMV